jgi:non-specific serine/threonine protein kinase
VAVKVLSSSRLGSEGRARLLREAQAAARLNHPNIISVYDAGETAVPGQAGSVPFIVMEFVEGRSVYDQKPQSLDEVMAITRQVCAALEHAHSSGIIHRDLKPENVLVTPEGNVKLMDFGLARSSATRVTIEGAIVGTVFYLAPEQALGQEIDNRTDLYALGVMLYELTTGRLPFTGDDPVAIIAQHLHAPVTPPSAHQADIPPLLETVILKLLAKNPAERFASAHEVALALSQATEVTKPASVPAFANNLPLHLSTFIGREREIDEVKRRLSLSRLVTLTGAGGSGKTRLALEVAADLLNTFPDGIWLVELAPLADPALVPQAVASVLDVGEQPGRHLVETVVNYLRSRRLLLLLDNCEHLIEACATLAETFLRTCANLRILATSREAIGITGENAWAVPTLSIPDLRHLPTQGPDLVSTLVSYEAVQLFLDRAIAVQPAFTLTNENAAAVAQICHRLDGIPLAIELAAARLRALSVTQIAARLDDRFNLLTVGSRTALPRHQTLRATIDWSYELLPKVECVLLRRLSVFANGWTLEAAEAVCVGDGLKRRQALDLLTRLVDKSLVVVEEQAKGVRYRLLDTLRQYAWEKALESGELEPVQARHLHFFVNFAATAQSHLREASQIEWLDQLETEHDNLRAAMEWALGHGETEAGLRLAGDLALFWYLRGYWSEGREWLERALGQSDELSPGDKLSPSDGQSSLAARAKALYGAAWLADERGREEPLYRASMELCQQIGDRWGAAFCLRGLGVRKYIQGDQEQAASLLEESLDYFRQTEDDWGIALALFSLGWMAIGANESERAETLWRESLELFRRTGDRWGRAVTLGSLSYTARQRGSYKKAAKLSKESLALFKELRDKAGMAQSLARLASVAYHRDDFKQATALLEESLILQKELGYTTGIAFTFDTLGLIACYQGNFKKATALLAESLALWRETGDQEGIASALYIQGLISYYQGESNRAVTLWQESLKLSQEQENKSGMASALSGLGRAALYQGEYQQAAELLQQSLVLYREMGEKHNVADTLYHLGKVRRAQGDQDQTATLIKESLIVRRELGAKRGIAETLEEVSMMIGARQPERAARLLGAAEVIREAIGVPLPPIEHAAYEQNMAALQAKLGEAAFDAAWREGRALTIEKSTVEAIGEALAEALAERSSG